jgi:hypothetical protein
MCPPLPPKRTNEKQKGSAAHTFLLITLINRQPAILPLFKHRFVVPKIPSISIPPIPIPIPIPLIPLASIPVTIPLIPTSTIPSIPIRSILTRLKLIITTPLRRALKAIKRLPIDTKRPLTIPRIRNGAGGLAAEGLGECLQVGELAEE